MVKFKDIIITDLGQHALNEAITGHTKITFTKAVLASDDVASKTVQDVKAITTLDDQKETSVALLSSQNGAIVLSVTYDNDGLTKDIIFNSVGWYAMTDSTEFLFAVSRYSQPQYLTAVPPDTDETQSITLQVSLAVGQGNVQVVQTQAGVAMKADLSRAIKDWDNSIQQLTDIKADKSQVASDLAKKADQSSVDASVKSINDVLATKADKATVESELSTKANQSDLDKTNAEVAKKASTTDVNSQLATKADAKDVTDALALKDDTVDVDKKISNVTNSVNSLSSTVTSNKSATDTALGTKANANDVANSFEEVRNRVKKLEGQQELTAPDFNTLTSTSIYMIENPTNGKNSPSNGNWGTLVVSRGTTGSDSRILQEYYPDSGDLPYFRMSGPGGVWRDWKQLSDQSEINSLRDAVNTKANASDVYTKKQVDDAFSSRDATIATKADKATVDAEIAKIDFTPYAKSADVASDVKTLTDSIATKADAKTVNDAISKIDFTPYAKSADVDSKLKGYTDTADLTKLLAGKADSDFSYSKAELDKKLLDLTTTTGGKVDASQVATMIENKADKSDVTKQIGTVTDLVNTKANSTDVTAALDKKDDITDVDAKIKKVTDLANKAQSTADSKVKSNWAIDNSNGKFVAANVPAVGTATQSFTQAGLDLLNTLATQSQVADAKNTANQAISDYNKRPVIRGNDGDDLLAYKTNQLRLYVNVKNCKNLPPAANTQWFTVEYVFESPYGDGIAIFRSPASEVWLNGNNGGIYGNWLRLANAGDITNLQNAINTKANSSDVYSKSEVDSKTTTTIVTGYDIPSKTRQTMSAGVNAKWLVDPSVIDIVADQINQLKGRRTIDTPDFNSLTDGGSYYITNPQGGKNGPTGSWGNLFVSNGNGHRISQLYFPDDGSAPFMRELDESTWHNWIQLSTKQDVNNALNGKANTGDVTALQNKVNVNTPLFREISADSTWEDIFGVTNPNNVLTSLRINPGGSGQLVNDFAAGIGFGGADAKGVLSVAYGNHQARITGGNGGSPVWSEDIAWKSDINNLQGQINNKANASDLASKANASDLAGYAKSTDVASKAQITDLQNQISELKESNFEVQTFKDETSGKTWEAQKPGHRLAIIQS